MSLFDLFSSREEVLKRLEKKGLLSNEEIKALHAAGLLKKKEKKEVV